MDRLPRRNEIWRLEIPNQPYDDYCLVTHVEDDNIYGKWVPSDSLIKTCDLDYLRKQMVDYSKGKGYNSWLQENGTWTHIAGNHLCAQCDEPCDSDDYLCDGCRS